MTKKRYSVSLCEDEISAEIQFEIDFSVKDAEKNIIEASTFWADHPPEDAPLEDHIQHMLEIHANAIFWDAMSTRNCSLAINEITEDINSKEGLCYYLPRQWYTPFISVQRIDMPCTAVKPHWWHVEEMSHG